MTCFAFHLSRQKSQYVLVQRLFIATQGQSLQHLSHTRHLQLQFWASWSWIKRMEPLFLRYSTLTNPREKRRFNLLTVVLPPDSTEEPFPLFQSSSWCLLGQVPISQSECSRAYLTSHKTLQSEAQRQQILFQRWLQEPTTEEHKNPGWLPKRLAKTCLVVSSWTGLLLIIFTHCFHFKKQILLPGGRTEF